MYTIRYLERLVRRVAVFKVCCDCCCIESGDHAVAIGILHKLRLHNWYNNANNFSHNATKYCFDNRHVNCYHFYHILGHEHCDVN
jgi:hypothetical protein